MTAITRQWLRARSLGVALLRSTSGIAATEFAMILPILLVLFFGVVEISNGVAAYRKVTLMAHTLSDLTSQSQEVQDSDLTKFFRGEHRRYDAIFTGADQADHHRTLG